MYCRYFEENAILARRIYLYSFSNGCMEHVHLLPQRLLSQHMLSRHSLSRHLLFRLTYYLLHLLSPTLVIKLHLLSPTHAITLHLLSPTHAIMLHLLSPTLTIYKICYLASQMISFLCSLYKNIPIPSILSDSKTTVLEAYLESIVLISKHRLIEYIFTVTHQNMWFLLYLIKCITIISIISVYGVGVEETVNRMNILTKFPKQLQHPYVHAHLKTWAVESMHR